MIGILSKLRAFLHRILEFAILSVLFFVPWWWRPDWMPRFQYDFGFIITLPMIIAIVCWFALGGPGLRAVFRDSRKWWLLAFGGFVGWAMISPQWASHPDQSITAEQQFALAALFTLVATCATPRLSRVVAALACGLIVQGAVCFGQVVMQQPIGLQAIGEFEIEPGNAGLSVVIAESNRLMRPYGLTIHPNVVGGYMVVALLALLGWLILSDFASDSSHRNWLIVLAVVIFGFWCVLITFSRSAWLGLLVGGIVLIIFARHVHLKFKWPRVQLLIGAAIALLLIFGLSYWNFIWVRATTGDETTELRSISDRLYFSRIALQLIIEHPLVGIGIGMFPQESNDIINAGPYRGWLAGQNVHDMPLLVFSELGIIGFGLWGVTLLSAVWVAWHRIHSPYAIGLFAAVVAMLTISLFDHYFWSILHFQVLLWAGLGIAFSDDC